MKTARSLFSQILWPLLTVSLVAVLLATWYALSVMYRFHLQEVAAGLEVQARIIGRYLERPFEPDNAARTDALCKELGRLTHTRITIILPTGQVLADSDEDPAAMDNHGARPEVVEALGGHVGHAKRYSHTIRSDWFYVAVPLGAGVIRTSASLSSVDSAIRNTFLKVGFGSLAVALSAILAVLLLARRLRRPLQDMERGAERFARGDFERALAIPGSTELATLAEAMNQMALQIRDRMQAMEQQRNELQAVLSSMAEGVIAVDTEQRVIRINRAAALLLGTDLGKAAGRTIEEVGRNPKLQECVKRILTEGVPFEDEIALSGVKEVFLRVSAALLHGEKDEIIGATLVFNDITEVRALERARSDFVANVSHELRTPVTSIKGYAETLLHDRPYDSAMVENFLDIIVRQSARLSTLVDDILSLANLERAESAGDIVLGPVGFREVIDAAVTACAPKAAQKRIEVTVVCEDGICARANEGLLEQAILNLLDNAIKYSEPGGKVLIEARRHDETLRIDVRDWGMGIAAEDTPRIFERFYRVDRARSRKLGGTGLGLSIVKHIVAVHGGQVSVESALGKGSCFTMMLPTA